jgi:hypothetical protein
VGKNVEHLYERITLNLRAIISSTPGTIQRGGVLLDLMMRMKGRRKKKKKEKEAKTLPFITTETCL